jgi:hypothetical protein
VSGQQLIHALLDFGGDSSIPGSLLARSWQQLAPFGNLSSWYVYDIDLDMDLLPTSRTNLK